jgi:hypothetical protein
MHPYAGTDKFKTLAREVADFYQHYVEPGKGKPMSGFSFFEKWMSNIKKFTEDGGDGRFSPRFGDSCHFSLAFLYVMRFTFSDESGQAYDRYHDNFVRSFLSDPVLQKAWMQVLNAMFAYLQMIETENELRAHYLRGEYSKWKQKLAEYTATPASNNGPALQQMKRLVRP